jgi:SAM-dependent methyltransferase
VSDSAAHKHYQVPRLPRYKWPKELPPLSAEQQHISDDFMAYWLSVLPQNYGVVERFNHGYVLKSLDHFPRDCKIRTLEIGSGIGAHIGYEPLDRQEYHCVDLREPLVQKIRESYPSVTATVADCQKELSYGDGYFDRAVAVHVLEHLPDLPKAIDEIYRVLVPGGVFAIVYPCDPGLAYEIARKISAERLFRSRYRMPYRWLVRQEHINAPGEIEFLIREKFNIIDKTFFPLRLPIKNVNLCIGVTATKEGQWKAR